MISKLFLSLLLAVFWSVLVVVPPSVAGAAVPPALSVDEYLQEVARSNPGYRGLLEASAGARETSKKADLIFSPQLVSDLQYIDNTLDTHAPLIEGTSNIERNIRVGIRGQTPWGLSLELTYNRDQSMLFNTDPAFVTAPYLTNTYVNPQFKLSLWQNFLGRADRANQKVMEAEDLATAYGKAYEARALLVDSEARYWRLATIREVLRVERESVARAQAFLDLDLRKARRRLMDPADVLTAQAAVKGKELELSSMLDDERSAARAFNTARGVDSDEVAEELLFPPPAAVRALAPGKRVGMRGDVKASQQASIAESQGKEMAREKLLPEVTLYGSVFAYGVNLTVPLNVGTVATARDGYEEQAGAADLTFQRKVMEEQDDWSELVRRFEDAKRKLAIALELERIQRSKFENVRKRESRGLTIEDQVFQYELDYLNASLARVQAEGQILGLRAQMKLYGDSSGDSPK